MRGCLALFVVILGCGGARTEKVSPELAVDEYTMLQEANLLWTYRDDGVSLGSPTNSTLIRGRNAGDGVLDLRRGSRWADGEQEGKVAFSQTDRIRIVEWELGDSSGEGNFPLAKSKTQEGDEVAEGGWSCTVERPDLVETYYGDFSDVLTFACSGSDGPVGDWHFAKDVGLVAFDSDAYQLDLVAPW